MNRVKSLTQRSIETPFTQSVTRPRPEKTIYKDARALTATQARINDFQKSSSSMLESKQKARRSLVSDKTKPDIVKVTAESQQLLYLPAAEKQKQLYLTAPEKMARATILSIATSPT